MRRIAFFVLICVAFAGCAKAQGIDGQESPGQEVRQDAGKDEYLFDFGTISDKAPVTHTFTFVNNGEKNLAITGRTNSCGCTTSTIDKETILPGESAQVKVVFNPKGYHGSVNQHVYVNTDDPDHSVYKFSVRADVR